MSSIVEVTRVARELFGLDCTVKFQETRVAEGIDRFTAMQVTARAIKHRPGDPHAEVECIEGPPSCFESPEPLLNGQGRAVREQLEPRALAGLYETLLAARDLPRPPWR